MPLVTRAMSNIAISIRSSTDLSAACGIGRTHRFIATCARDYFRRIEAATSKRRAISGAMITGRPGRRCFMRGVRGLGMADYAYRAAPGADPIGYNPPLYG